MADAWLGPAVVQRRGSSHADRALSSVIATLLMALITVTMALALSDFVSDTVPETAPQSTWDLGASLAPGESLWGDGDERVELVHRGGPELFQNQTRVRIDVDGDVTTYEGTSLGGAFDDGAFTLGEAWNRTLEVPANAPVNVRVIVTSVQQRVVADAELRSGVRDCSTDTTPPTLSGVTQEPGDVDSAHSGSITVTATLTDACAGVDGATDPHLEYRVGNGSSFEDAGAMTKVSTASWQGEIPEPSDDWAGHEDETLTYRLDPIADLAGNEATSENRTDHIQAGEADPGTLTYATDHIAFSGTVENASNLQDGDDGGQAANLTENATGSGPVTSEIYGTAHSADGATAPGNATGSPDDGHATLPTAGDSVGVSGFNTFTGGIDVVEIAFEGHANGTANGADDELEISYEVAGTPGDTTRTYTLSELDGDSDGPASYINVTGDRAWNWTDVGDLRVVAEYIKQQAEDDADFHIDALWTRVTYEDPDWNLSVRVNVTGIPTGSQHDLEIAYDTSDEAFHLDVYNHTAGTWEDHGPSLDATTRTNETVELDDAHVDGGDAWVRFHDDGPDAVDQDTLALDYVRVRTT